MLKLDALTGKSHGCSEKLRNPTETQVDPFSPVFERGGLGAYHLRKDFRIKNRFRSELSLYFAK